MNTSKQSRLLAVMPSISFGGLYWCTLENVYGVIGNLYILEAGLGESFLGSMTWTLAWGMSARLGGYLMKTYAYNTPYFLQLRYM